MVQKTLLKLTLFVLVLKFSCGFKFEPLDGEDDAKNSLLKNRPVKLLKLPEINVAENKNVRKVTEDINKIGANFENLAIDLFQQIINAPSDCEEFIEKVHEKNGKTEEATTEISTEKVTEDSTESVETSTQKINADDDRWDGDNEILKGAEESEELTPSNLKQYRFIPSHAQSPLTSTPTPTLTIQTTPKLRRRLRRALTFKHPHHQLRPNRQTNPSMHNPRVLSETFPRDSESVGDPRFSMSAGNLKFPSEDREEMQFLPRILPQQMQTDFAQDEPVFDRQQDTMEFSSGPNPTGLGSDIQTSHKTHPTLTNLQGNDKKPVAPVGDSPQPNQESTMDSTGTQESNGMNRRRMQMNVQNDATGNTAPVITKFNKEGKKKTVLSGDAPSLPNQESTMQPPSSSMEPMSSSMAPTSGQDSMANGPDTGSARMNEKGNERISPVNWSLRQTVPISENPSSGSNSNQWGDLKVKEKVHPTLTKEDKDGKRRVIPAGDSASSNQESNPSEDMMSVSISPRPNPDSGSPAPYLHLAGGKVSQPQQNADLTTTPMTLETPIGVSTEAVPSDTMMRFREEPRLGQALDTFELTPPPCSKSESPRGHIDDLKDEVSKLRNLVEVLRDQQEIIKILDRNSHRNKEVIPPDFNTKDIMKVMEEMNSDNKETKKEHLETNDVSPKQEVDHKTEIKELKDPELDKLKYQLKTTESTLNETKKILTEEQAKEVLLEKELENQKREMTLVKYLLQSILTNRIRDNQKQNSTANSEVVAASTPTSTTARNVPFKGPIRDLLTHTNFMDPNHLLQQTHDAELKFLRSNILDNIHLTHNKNAGKEVAAPPSKTRVNVDQTRQSQARESNLAEIARLLNILNHSKVDSRSDHEIRARILELEEALEKKKRDDDLEKQLLLIDKLTSNSKAESKEGSDLSLIQKLLHGGKAESKSDSDIDGGLKELQEAIEKLRPKDEGLGETKQQPFEVMLDKLISNQGLQPNVGSGGGSGKRHPLSSQQIAAIKSIMGGSYGSASGGYGGSSYGPISGPTAYGGSYGSGGGYGGNSGGYGTSNGGYGAGPNGYGASAASYGPVGYSGGGYGGGNSAYGGYGGSSGGYGNSGGATTNYGGPVGGYGSGAPAYGSPAGGYATAAGGYGGASGGYKAIPTSGGYGPSNGGYAPTSGGYGQSSNGGYGPSSGGYGPSPTGGYGAPAGGYGAPAGSYGAPAGGYGGPTGGYGTVGNVPASGGYGPATNGYGGPVGGYGASGNGYGGNAGGYTSSPSGYTPSPGIYTPPPPSASGYNTPAPAPSYPLPPPAYNAPAPSDGGYGSDTNNYASPSYGGGDSYAPDNSGGNGYGSNSGGYAAPAGGNTGYGLGGYGGGNSGYGGPTAAYSGPSAGGGYDNTAASYGSNNAGYSGAAPSGGYAGPSTGGYGSPASYAPSNGGYGGASGGYSTAVSAPSNNGGYSSSYTPAGNSGIYGPSGAVPFYSPSGGPSSVPIYSKPSYASGSYSNPAPASSTYSVPYPEPQTQFFPVAAQSTNGPGAYSYGANAEKPSYYPATNPPSYGDYQTRKIEDLKVQISGLQGAINAMNNPTYTQRPEDQQTIYNLERQINDLKNIVSGLSAGYSGGYSSNTGSYSGNAGGYAQSDNSGYEPAPANYASQEDKSYQAKSSDKSLEEKTSKNKKKSRRRRRRRSIDNNEIDLDNESVNKITKFLGGLLTDDPDVSKLLRSADSTSTPAPHAMPRQNMESIQDRLESLRKQKDRRGETYRRPHVAPRQYRKKRSGRRRK